MSLSRQTEKGRTRVMDMRRCAYLVMGWLILGNAYAVGAQNKANAPTDDVKIVLADVKFQDALKASKGVDPSNAYVVYLVLDHETLEWSVYHSKPPAKPGDISKDNPAALLGPDGNLRVMRSSTETPVIVVTKANPFLYTYEGKVSAPQDSPDAAALKKAAKAVGDAISAMVPQVRGFTAQIEARGLKSDDIKEALGYLAEERNKVHRYLQALETGSALPDPDPKNTEAILKKGVDALAILDASSRELSCYQVWAPLLKLSNLPSISDDDLKTAREEMMKTSPLGDSDCGDIVKAAFEAHDKTKREADCAQRPSRLLDQPGASIAKKILALDKPKKDLQAAANQLSAFIRLGRDQGLGPKAGDNWTWPFSKKIAVLVPPFPHQTWLQDNPGAISIKPENSVYPDCIRLKPAGVERKFLLASRRQAVLGIGFGIIAYTNLKDPTFGTVHTDANTQMVARTSEESRSGAIVAMAFLRPRMLACRDAKPWPIEPGLEFGAGLDAKKPALFVGGGVEVLRYVRIGAGLTCQVISRLADGLKPASFDANGQPIPGTGTVVYALTDVRTQKKAKCGLYVGLTFALDALPLFSPSK
jgi:hypothetical protein